MIKTFNVIVPLERTRETMSWALERFGGSYFDGKCQFDSDKTTIIYKFFDKNDALEFKLKFGI